VAGEVSAEHVVLALNSGSSSRKAALYRVSAAGEEQLAAGAAEHLDTPEAQLRLRGAGKDVSRALSGDAARTPGALGALLDELDDLGLPPAQAVGHRIVHGGAHHVAPERVDSALLDELEALVPLSPLHLPGGIAGIREAGKRLPGVPQVACFDTAFHRAMPDVAERFALPRELYEAGVRRYGFHGLSYEYILRRLGPTPPSRVVIAHLGNGASLAAVREGRSIDTTMGLCPTGGFMMGTRSGDLDPGVLVYLLRERGLDANALDRLVNRQSGLLGVSGTSPDMKTLLERRPEDPDAALAVRMFAYQVRKFIGAFAAALGGLDLLVFTGGIGERAAPVRWEVASGLEHLGVVLDRERNERGADPLTTADSRTVVRVIPTDEDVMIARHAFDVVFAGWVEKPAR
jgi:acetate kinase